MKKGSSQSKVEKTMPVTYTNRKEMTYFLCKGTTKTGKPRYFFAREPKGETVDAIPEGYRVEESVNGIVSLVKDLPRLITPEERAAVEAALNRHPKGDHYRLGVKHNQIVVYERLGPDVEILNTMFGIFGPLDHQHVREHLDRSAQYTPIMRFILDEPEKRDYHAERWCYRGSIDDWIYAGQSGKIETLARKLIPTLGTDDFYELY
jgi:hypothetical protein